MVTDDQLLRASSPEELLMLAIRYVRESPLQQRGYEAMLREALNLYQIHLSAARMIAYGAFQDHVRETALEPDVVHPFHQTLITALFEPIKPQTLLAHLQGFPEPPEE